MIDIDAQNAAEKARKILRIADPRRVSRAHVTCAAAVSQCDEQVFAVRTKRQRAAIVVRLRLVDFQKDAFRRGIGHVGIVG